MRDVIASLLLALGQLADPVIWRILAKSVLVTLAVFVLAGAACWYALDALLDAAGLSASLFAGADTLRGAAAALLTALGLWLTWRIAAMAVIGFFADEVVEAVEARHYPAAASAARNPSLGEQAAASLRAAIRALVANLLALPVALALLVTGVGTALLLLLVNAWLIGRELLDMVWLRHRRGNGDAPPVTAAERFVLGGAIAALLAVPFVNFLAPVLGAAGAAHLVHRRGRA